MKKFYSGKYIRKEVLEENNIHYPIRVDYYSILNEEKYGLEVVKTEYRNEGVKVENKVIKNLTKDEKQIDLVLLTLSKGIVTPICTQEVVDELLNIPYENKEREFIRL